MIVKNKVVILGAGISGLSASYHLNEAGTPSVIYEKDDVAGGLCGNFEIQGFRFDRFIHLSFTSSAYVQSLFAEAATFYTHEPRAFNYYRGMWLKHPAQNNLFPLSEEEKAKIIEGFKKRPEIAADKIENYEQWLRVQYGDYFAENFPLDYTLKYWTLSASHLETKWIGSRMYKPSLEEVMQGAQSEDTPNTYYAKEMRYPKKGGYKAFLSGLEKGADIQFGREVVRIDCQGKRVQFSDGSEVTYDTLISSLPLPELCKMIVNAPQQVVGAGSKLKWTSAYQVSIGLSKRVPLHLWFYIYGEDILPSRVYSPSRKSPDNVPDGCSSLQAEIFFSEDRPMTQTSEQILQSTISSLVDMGVISAEDIRVKDIRIEKYANVIFTHDIYQNRAIIHDYLDSVGIQTIGRFGKWGYLWSDQSLLTGKAVAERLAGWETSGD